MRGATLPQPGFAALFLSIALAATVFAQEPTPPAEGPKPPRQEAPESHKTKPQVIFHLPRASGDGAALHEQAKGAINRANGSPAAELPTPRAEESEAAGTGASSSGLKTPAPPKPSDANRQNAASPIANERQKSHARPGKASSRNDAAKGSRGKSHKDR